MNGRDRPLREARSLKIFRSLLEIRSESRIEETRGMVERLASVPSSIALGARPGLGRKWAFQ